MTTERETKRAAIWALRKQGKAPAEIVRTTGYQKTLVYRWCKRFANGEGLSDRGRSGRPKALSNNQLKYLKKRVKGRRHHSTRREAARLQVGHVTVWRSFRNLGLRKYRRPRMPRLNQGHKAKRLAFAQEHASDQDWHDNVVFSDESHFYWPAPTNTQNDVVWAEDPNDVPPMEVEQYPPYRMSVFGAISMKGKLVLAEYTGTLDAAAYQALLQGKALPSIEAAYEGEEFVFMQDHAKAHTAKSTLEFLEESKVQFLEPDEYPPKSPDLNPIENIWGIMKQEVYSKQYRSKDDFKSAVQASWDRLSLQLVQDTIKNYPGRLQAVLDNLGAYPRQA